MQGLESLSYILSFPSDFYCMVLTALQAHYIYFIEVTGSPPVLILQSALSSITPNILTAIIFFAFLVGSSEGSASQGRVPPSADTHRKDCPEAKTRSRRSSERGHGIEAQRAGLEVRVRCLMLPGGQEPNNIQIAVSCTSRPRPLGTRPS